MHKVFWMLGSVALFAQTSAEAASNRKKKPVYEQESFIVGSHDAKSAGCFMKYTRRHAKGDLNKDVAFGIECCQSDVNLTCCGHSSDPEAGIGYPKGCQPILPGHPWVSSAQMKQAAKIACDTKTACQIAATLGGSAATLAFGAGAVASLSTGNVMGATLCASGGAASAGLVNWSFGRARELQATADLLSKVEARECSKVTAETEFRPNQFIRLEKEPIENIVDASRAALKRTYQAEGNFIKNAHDALVDPVEKWDRENSAKKREVGL